MLQPLRTLRQARRHRQNQVCSHLDHRLNLILRIYLRRQSGIPDEIKRNVKWQILELHFVFLREKIFRKSSEESESNGEPDYDGNKEPDREYFEGLQDPQPPQTWQASQTSNLLGLKGRGGFVWGPSP